MTLARAELLTKNLLKHHGLRDWRFAFNNSRTAFGYCCGEDKLISLSNILTFFETNDECVIDTIKHEIAHALDYKIRGFSKHDKTWKKLAIDIGCNGKRCGEENGIKLSHFYYKYHAKCKRCQTEFYRFRLSVKNSYACPKCCEVHNNNNFHQRYVLNYKKIL